MTTTVDFSSLLWLVMTSAVWGISTPLLRRGSKGIERARHSNAFIQFLLELKFMATNLNYALPFLLNQSGSIIYTISLAYNELSIAVPFTNAINFVFVIITSVAIKESYLSARSLLGAFLVMIGVIVCVISKT